MKDDKKKKKVKRKEQDLWSGITIDLSNMDSSDEDDRKEDNNMTDGKVATTTGRTRRNTTWQRTLTER